MFESLIAGNSGVVTYGITPPKRSWSDARIAEVAMAQAERIRGLDVDGLVVYDLQDESSRTDVERPFPYEEPIDPVWYAHDRLGDVGVPRIVYRCVARLEPQDLAASLERLGEAGDLTVLVGAASSSQAASMSLREAYELRRQGHADVPVGGVLIGERHRGTRAEHERVLRKVDDGCSFFVSQAVYSTTATKDVLSDLRLACEEQERTVPPVLVTLTPCGSERTLAFLRWLGVEVPRWIENDLLRAHDTLAKSVHTCLRVFDDLWDFARERGIPLGCNVESVSLSRREVNASVDLVAGIREIMSG